MRVLMIGTGGYIGTRTGGVLPGVSYQRDVRRVVEALVATPATTDFDGLGDRSPRYDPVPRATRSSSSGQRDDDPRRTYPTG